MVYVQSLITQYPNRSRAIIVSRVWILSLVRVTKICLECKFVTQITTGHVQHLFYVWSLNTMMCVLEDASLRKDVAHEHTHDLTLHIPTLTVVLVPVPIYDLTHHCAPMGYIKVQWGTWIWQHGAEQQPDLEILLQVLDKVQSMCICVMIPWTTSRQANGLA